MRPGGIHIQPLLRREPCAAPVRGRAWKEILALLPNGSVHSLEAHMVTRRREVRCNPKPPFALH